MYDQKTVERIASKLIAAIEVKYLEKPNMPGHAFKAGKDIIKVYDNPAAVKRFTAVISGKEWGTGSVKTFVKFSDNGNSTLATGVEDEKLGKPVLFKSIPLNLRKMINEKLGGKYDLSLVS